MLALMLLGPAAVAFADGRDVLADAKDSRIDACYSRADFRDAVRLARADQRLYGAELDIIATAGITQVAVPGRPCGSGRAVPAGAIAVGSSGGAGVWGAVAVAAAAVGVGAGAVARRAGRGRR